MSDSRDRALLIAELVAENSTFTLLRAANPMWQIERLLARYIEEYAAAKNDNPEDRVTVRLARCRWRFLLSLLSRDMVNITSFRNEILAFDTALNADKVNQELIKVLTEIDKLGGWVDAS